VKNSLLTEAQSVEGLSIIVRGSPRPRRGAPKWHAAKQFNISPGRNPDYSAFYLSDKAHVQEALDIVLRAKTL
jgi:hypothetical protein